MINTHKSKDSKDFTKISRDIFNDTRLSFAALGTLIFLLNKPCDYKVTISLLAADMDISEYQSRNILRDLQRLGYAVYRPLQSGGEWDIYETPLTGIGVEK